MEFGIATLVASHLLGEIERVCSYLLAIDAGRLLRAAPLATFTQRTGTLAIEVEDGAAQLADRLGAGGLPARVDGRTVLVEVPEEGAYIAIRDAILLKAEIIRVALVVKAHPVLKTGTAAARHRDAQKGAIGGFLYAAI